MLRYLGPVGWYLRRRRRRSCPDTVMVMTITSTDPRIASVPVRETWQPLVALGASFGPARARVRHGVAARLRRAQVALPVGMSIRVVEGHSCGPVADGVAAHVTGAAVDITLVDLWGRELHAGMADAARIVLARVLTDAGL